MPERMIMRLFGAPNWMVNHTKTPGPAVWPLRRDHYDHFAQFCATVAKRYPDVTYFEVWNELDGFVGNYSWDRLDGLTADYQAYTELFIKVSKAVKAVNPHAKLGGPYVPISAGQLPPGRSSECAGDWGAINPAILKFISHFVRDAKGHYDFFTLDGHLAYEAYRLNGTTWHHPANDDPLGSTRIFPAMTRWVRESSGLDRSIPIWWAEFYPVPCVDTGNYGPSGKLWPLEQQLAVYKKMLHEISEPSLGVEVALNWAAQAGPNCMVGMYNDTSAAHGGYPTPFYKIVKDINEMSAVRPAQTPPPTPKKGGGSCSAAAGIAGCAYGGECVDERCRCDATWTGPHCDQLHLLPARVGSGYPTGGAPSSIPTNSTFTWGGAVVRDPDSPTPLFHGFFTEYLNHCPMTYGTWSTSTQIRHAISHSPAGPYMPSDVAVPDAAGNPVLTRSPDGYWLLYFTNIRWTGSSRNCTGPVDEWGAPIYCSASGKQCATGMSLAYSRSLSGPWTYKYGVVNFGCTNPGAPVFGEDGSILMAYKTWTKGGRCIGVVTAPSWRDWPYDTFPLGSVDSCIAVEPHVEDPSNLWRDARGTIHMLVHQDGFGGAAHSADGGRTWAFNASAKVYPYTLSYEDGSELACDAREEPKVLLEASATHGGAGVGASVPSMLINVCRVRPDLSPSSRYKPLPNTAPTAAFPQGEAQYITQVTMQPISPSSELER